MAMAAASRWCRGWLSVALCLLPGVSLAAEEPKTSVADLRYGVSLYHYYQQDYLSALTELMVADSRDGIQGHADNPELMAAGISLAFGMEHHAERLFQDLLQGEKRPQRVRDAAWFYLGKLHYIRGNWNEAEQSFARVSADFNPVLTGEMRALQINLQIRRDQLTPIPLKRLNQEQLGNWSPYALYNMGSAYARAGDYMQASSYYRELVKLDVPENPRLRAEYWTLQDKAHTAMGYAFLLRRNYTSAIEQFSKVLLSGSQSNQALLGYGWAAVEQEDYELAIRPWQVLRQRSLIYPPVQESLLALPFAYEKMGAEGDALSAYETAESLLTAEIELVQDMRATLTKGELLTIVGARPVTTEELDAAAADPVTDPTILTAVVTDDGQNWLKLDRTSVIKTRSAYLTELFAQNEFQTAVLDLRDLLRLRKVLQDWQPKLDIYADLLEEKQRLRQQQEQRLAQQALDQQRVVLQQERDQLAARLQRIVDNNDVMALADDNSRELYEMVQRSETTLQRMAQSGEDTSDYAESLRMYRGILLWQAAQQFPERLWANEKHRQQIDEALAQLDETSRRIDAITSTNLDIRPMMARIRQLQNETQDQLVEAERVIDIRAEALREQVDRQLAGHQKRLTAYLAQSHLAVARLYDKALRKQAP
jgi:hypothetical protein